jgi:pantetheine-phosphate adenylyltransferase
VRVAIGGTFDPLHDGHKKLLKKVYELSEGSEIVIGVTSDRMARASRNRVKVRTVELHDRYGVTLDEDFDYIVISPETYEVALQINELRKEREKKPITIVKVEHAKAADGKAISSTRIKEGEIDTHGALLNGK